MDTRIIIAIIAILVLIIIVVVYMRSKNRAPTMTKGAAKQPLKVGSKSKKDTVPNNTDENAQPVKDSTKTQQSSQPAPVTSQGDSIEVAQGFIDEQRYDDAIEALKEKLKFDPTHSKALLALLSVYVTTDNQSEFDKVYSYVQSKADILTLQEAKQLRSSAGYDELASSTVQPTSVSPIADTEDAVFLLDDAVDFEDTPAETSEAPVQSVDLNVNADDSSDLSFEALDSTDFTNNESTLEDEAAVSSIEDISDTDDNFDFSFDDEIDETPSIKADAPVTRDPAGSNLVDSIDSDDTVFDLSFDDDSNSISDASSTSSDLNFDEAFGIEKQPHTPAVPTNDALTLDNDANNDNDDFSFDLDELEEVTDSTSTPAVNDADIDGTDEAFDFSELSTEKAPAEAVVEDSNRDDALDNIDNFENLDDIENLDNFDFDLDSDTNSTAPVSDLSDTIADLDAEDMSDNNKTVELVNSDISNNELSFDDIEDTVADPSKAASTLSEFDFDDLTEADLIDDDLDSTKLDSIDSDNQDVANSETASFDNFDFDLDEPIADTSEDVEKLDIEELDFSADLNDNVNTNLKNETLLDTTDETKTKVLEDTLSDTQLSSTEPESSDEIVLDWDEPLEDTTTVIQPADDLSSSTELSGESTAVNQVDKAFDSDSISVTKTPNIKTTGTNKPVTPESVDSTKIESEISEEINADSNAGLEDTLAQLDAIQALDTFDTDISDLDDLDEDKDNSGLLDLSEEVDDSVQPPSAPVTDIKVDDLVEPSDSATPIAPVEDISKSAGVSDDEFSKSFGFIEDLDKSQITLDLAEQYLELGEYDSAKRLITEVLNTHGSTLQKNKAKELLDRIS